MKIEKLILWLRRWPVIDWGCVAAVCVVNTGVLIIITMLHPVGYPPWTVVPSAILLAIASIAGFFRLWRPSKITKQDVVRTSVLFLIGFVLVVFGIGGFDQLRYIAGKRFNDLGFLGSIGLAAIYGGLWSFIRIATYWVTSRADFKSME